jgi:hypothetical protein
MTADAPEDPDRSEQAARAAQNYRATWHAIDSELYNLCRRRSSQQDFADVYAKVALVGRVYAAGIPRSSRAAGDREVAVARGLVELAGPIGEGLDGLAGRQFDRQAVAEIIELHAHVARGLLPYTGGTWQQSFVSKYLHFHCDLVPVYDSRALASIGRLVNWPRVYAARESIGRPGDWLTSYYNFATAFTVLYEDVRRDAGTQVSVKELDYLLWQPS